MAAARAGVLLVNLGTPDAPTAAAVRRYLAEFLADPRVVEIPRIVWLPILYGAVLTTRPKKVALKYETVWMPEGSPLRVYTERQAQLLRGTLGRLATPLRIDWAMRYGNPSLPSVLREMIDGGCERIAVIPLYPQYANSTTGSTIARIEEILAGEKKRPELRVLKSFHAHPAYIRAICDNIEAYWMKHGRPDRLLMSFHGLPKRQVDRGDPYQRECFETARLVAERLGWTDGRVVTSFQSRFGKAEWIKPYTTETIEELAKAGVQRIDACCPGFTADCLETLEEIATEAREDFQHAGGKEFNYIPVANNTEPFMKALNEIVLEELGDWVEVGKATEAVRII